MTCDLNKIWYSGVLRPSDFKVRNRRFKTADQKCKNQTDLNECLFKGVFRLIGYVFQVVISKFKVKNV